MMLNKKINDFINYLKNKLTQKIISSVLKIRISLQHKFLLNPEFDTCLRVAPLFPASILMSYLNFPKSVVNKSVKKVNKLP